MIKYLFNIYITFYIFCCYHENNIINYFCSYIYYTNNGTPSLLDIKNTIISTHTPNNNQFVQQVFANHMDTANSTEKTILHQGIIASEKPTQVKALPNETIEVVTYSTI